ncbi:MULTISPECIES: RBBP9/YdeN family alpha/beta hydrolase [Cupriavidus]|uniref:Alpha/beta fold hydrolase n=1 Tax=Cupriavidus oxalaticus TaxID=96344 RepID=A0A4P7L499_9BURK|nr:MULTISPECIES: alpha/beta fold hydrolase [Cupriavidus]MBF6991872.1 alpha/beta hydrolase [Cupriavidus sp. IK-TO18]QBY49855.1 alpha/beta fold hydrolase [Cupriavidus oxalaticus]
MSLTPDTTVLLVPGLRDHVAEHWQTLLQAQLPNARSVPPLEHDKLSRDARVAALDAALAEIDGPVVLVAHSAGVMITVHWAAHADTHAAAENRRKIRGALLATPADLETPMPAGYPDTATLAQHGWLPVPRSPLPFPTILAASRNDPLATYPRAAEMASDWGSKLVDLGEVGHLNPAAGYGPWPRATALIDELLRAG